MVGCILTPYLTEAVTVFFFAFITYLFSKGFIDLPLILEIILLILIFKADAASKSESYFTVLLYLVSVTSIVTFELINGLFLLSNKYLLLYLTFSGDINSDSTDWDKDSGKGSIKLIVDLPQAELSFGLRLDPTKNHIFFWNSY